MSLQQFVRENRLELIRRTRAKVASRPSPQPSEAEMEDGVPLFLSELATELCEEEERRRSGGGAGVGAEPAEASPPSNPNIARSATLHGLSLRRLGFTIEQVVHHYGDVCQAVTELAHEQGAMVTIAEFQTLNGCLDNAIAAAVTSWDEGRDQSLAEGEARRDVFRRELLNLVDTATVSLDALRAESDGAAAAVLDDCLAAMHSFLADSRWAAC